MKDRKLAALFLECARFTLCPDGEVRTIQPGPRDDSWMYATVGKFAEADGVILKNARSNVSFVAGRQYGVDPSGAEQLLRANADKEDLARGLGEFVKAAATALCKHKPRPFWFLLGTGFGRYLIERKISECTAPVAHTTTRPISY